MTNTDKSEMIVIPGVFIPKERRDDAMKRARKVLEESKEHMVSIMSGNMIIVASRDVECGTVSVYDCVILREKMYEDKKNPAKKKAAGKKKTVK